MIVPEGKIATGKLAQALVHGARVIALRGNFDQALALVRRLAPPHPISLVNSVNEFRIEGQKTAAFEIAEALDGRARRAVHPGGQRGQHHRLLAGLQPDREPAANARLPGRGGGTRWCMGAPVEHPETVASAIRIGNPARWEDAMDAMTARAARSTPSATRRSSTAYRFLASQEGIFCEPASAASVAGLLKHGAGDAQRVVCVLTGHGLKDPQPAIEQTAPVISCEAEIGAHRAGGAGVSLRRRRLVRVPASSANLGPGFDVLAAALSIHLELEVQETGDFAVHTDLDVRARPRQPRGQGDSSACIPADDFEFRISSEIPL